MAVSGADWRKSADGYRADTAPGAGFVRPEADGAHAVSNPRAGGCWGGVDRTLADDTDRNENGVAFAPVETGGTAPFRPPAIGVGSGARPVTEWPDDGHREDVDVDDGTGTPAGHDSDGGELSLRYLSTRSGCSTGDGDRRPVHEGAPGANESRGRTTDQTVIIK
jgi:hypothetical protein